MAAYAVARLDFPGKKLLVGAALLIAMFPQISLVTPLFNIERAGGLFDASGYAAFAEDVVRIKCATLAFLACGLPARAAPDEGP